MCQTARRVLRLTGCARHKGRVTYQRFIEMKMAPSGAIFGKTRRRGARVVTAPDEPEQAKRGGAGFRKARTYEKRRAATRGDELGRGIGPASPAGP